MIAKVFDWIWRDGTYYFSEAHEELCVCIAFLGELVAGLLCRAQQQKEDKGS